jgi:hypothetical protein
MNARPGELAALNELLQTESASLLARLAEAAPFVPPAAADVYAVVQRMVNQTGEHLAWLGQTIHELGGAVAPRRPAASTGELHYLEISYLLPRIVEDCRRLNQVYQEASGQVGANPAAAEVVGRILTRHAENLAALEQLAAPAR